MTKKSFTIKPKATFKERTQILGVAILIRFIKAIGSIVLLLLQVILLIPMMIFPKLIYKFKEIVNPDIL